MRAPRRASASLSRRSVWSGLTLRSAMSGRSANASATQSPTSSPIPTAVGSAVTFTSTGRKSVRTLGSPNCSATPSTAPNAAPMSPMTAPGADRSRAPGGSSRPDSAGWRRVDLPHDERVDAARHADAAKEQRDEADDAQEVAKLVDRFGEIELRLRGRAVPDARRLQPRAHPEDEPLQR
jgi:hypothetical protein